MQISSLIDIIDGRLLNSPAISFVYSLKTNPSKVKEGDLFVAKNKDDIKLAVQNGAFAIILENIHPIIDNEIAWIKVSDINLCLIQLLRYKLANFNLKAFYCDKVSYEFLNIFNTFNNINLFSNLNELIKKIDSIEENDSLICSNRNLLEKIYPNIRNFNCDVYEIKNLTQHSLFEVSFTYDDFYFSRLKLASLYIPQFISVYNFLERDIDFSKTKNLKYIKPIFLDKSFQIVDFGKSEKFVLVQDNIDLVNEEINFIKSKLKYAKTLFISNKLQKHLDSNQIVLDNIINLKETIKNISFNAVYIFGFDFDEVYENLNKLEKQDSLF